MMAYPASLNVFDLWETVPVSGEIPVAFAEAGEPEVSRWRLKLPPDMVNAATLLAQLEQQLDTAETRLQAVPERLDQLAQQLKAGPQSFGALPDSPEAELLGTLNRFQTGAGPVHYAFPLEESFFLQQTGEKFQAGFKRLTQLLFHLAWIETELDGRRLGQTVVQWGGSTRTVWGRPCSSIHLALHQRAVTVALNSRLKLLRILVVALEEASRLAALFSLAGGIGPILVLPLAWQYIYRVITEIQKSY